MLVGVVRHEAVADARMQQIPCRNNMLVRCYSMSQIKTLLEVDSVDKAALPPNSSNLIFCSTRCFTCRRRSREGTARTNSAALLVRAAYVIAQVCIGGLNKVYLGFQACLVFPTLGFHARSPKRRLRPEEKTGPALAFQQHFVLLCAFGSTSSPESRTMTR